MPHLRCPGGFHHFHHGDAEPRIDCRGVTPSCTSAAPGNWLLPTAVPTPSVRGFPNSDDGAKAKIRSSVSSPRGPLVPSRCSPPPLLCLPSSPTCSPPLHPALFLLIPALPFLFFSFLDSLCKNVLIINAALDELIIAHLAPSISWSPCSPLPPSFGGFADPGSSSSSAHIQAPLGAGHMRASSCHGRCSARLQLSAGRDWPHRGPCYPRRLVRHHLPGFPVRCRKTVLEEEEVGEMGRR